MATYQYHYGFGNEHQTECIPGALPLVQTNPQKVPLGLYAEQISGSTFVSEGSSLLRSWLYKKLPSVAIEDFKLTKLAKNWHTPGVGAADLFIDHPQTMRWSKPSSSDSSNQGGEWFDRLVTVCGTGSARIRKGAAMHLGSVSSDASSCFRNADAEMVFLPFSGSLNLETEFGGLKIGVGEIAVIPRGATFRFGKVKGGSEGAHFYLCENYGHPFQLPNRGLIGANGLANSRHFAYPQAQCFADAKGQMVTKYMGAFYQQTLGQSPLDVVAWFGNYAPYKYDLRLFNTMGSISFDHPDPSIFTVLSSPSGVAGEPELDFVIFPPRWLVGEETFRPPYFHRNVMSEYMGILYGTYDAKPGTVEQEGFAAGGGSLHNCMSPHGPELEAYRGAIASDLAPKKLTDTMAFMFESRFPWQVSSLALGADWRQNKYTECWQGFVSAKSNTE